MLSDEWLSRYGLLENFNASVTRTGTRTRTGTGTWTTGVTAIALCTSCSRANKIVFLKETKKYYLTLEKWALEFFTCENLLPNVAYMLHAILRDY